MPSRKIPGNLEIRGVDFAKKALSLVTFFVPAKKVTRQKAEAFDFRKIQRDLTPPSPTPPPLRGEEVKTTHSVRDAPWRDC